MNSSAITNSVMPTVSIPGTNPSERKGSGFGDVMASITDNWSEQSHQVKYDAAKSAQKNFDDRRSDMEAERSARDKRSINEARSEDRREDDPVRASHDDYEDHDDHAKIEDPKSDEPRDVEANSEDDRAGEDMETADGGDRSNDNEATSQDGEKTASASDETTSAESDDTKSDGNSALTADADVVDPNQPTQAVPLPGSPEAIELAKAEAAKMKAAGTNGLANAQNAALANGQAATGATNGSATADSTTDGLMNSTALSQPAAASSAKMALNGADAGAGDEMSSDKFLSRVVDSMTGDGKGKTDVTGTTNAATTGQTNNSTQQASAANPAQTAQAAQQAMAAAAGPNAQNNPTAAQNVSTNSVVTATGGTEATATANGQPGSTSSLHQTNTGGQTAHTARQAPSQQVQQQVAVSIRNAASEGVDKISVQLRPEHLGRVDVKMEIGQDGRIQGVIQADTRETLDMLRQDSRALQQALKDAGLNADSQSFTFEHRNEGGQSQEGNGQSRMTADQGSSPDEGDVMSGTELAEHVAIGYGINPNGLVDIRI
ncbi:flagellar hook-length control protein FliK [Thalassospira sp. ER-Se-21-Dark]|uniref:flagellar hook-length control protein FliK n=1 Tax=Thalassospira sp. ER-Se-21-Dark TaxID=2585190 RepID=UPI001B305F06|nr:flagellar hook-length control protein FliK [Thalassospira sp. ER-Se-21-Dark]MBP3126840.1 flagellar hook-length control protein FliK [Thalassospira sp. ER-Se-21-Dark]